MWVNLGSVHMEQDKLVEALAAFQNASLADPEYAPALSNMGRIYEDQGAVDVARHYYQQAYELEQTDALALSIALLLPAVMPADAVQLELNLDHAVLHLDQLLGSVERLERSGPTCAVASTWMADCPSIPQFRDPVNDFGSMGFYLSYYGFNLAPFKQKLAAVAELGHPGLRFTAEHLRQWQPPPEGRPISIGFVSRNFYDHSTGKWLLGLIQTLSRPAFNVTVVRPAKCDAVTGLFLSLYGITCTAIPAWK